MKLYKVKDWDEHFETHETRKLKTLAWIAVPTKMDGEGYTELLDHPNGAAHFGAWTAMAKLAASSRPRGAFSRTGGMPMPLSAIARMTRIPLQILEEAIPRFLEIGWLAEEEVEGNRENLPPCRDILPEEREKPTDTGTTGTTGTTDKQLTPHTPLEKGDDVGNQPQKPKRDPNATIRPKARKEPVGNYTEEFETFWAFWTNVPAPHGSKLAAMKWWAKKFGTPKGFTLEVIMAKAKEYAAYRKWQTSTGSNVSSMHASTFLGDKKEGWRDQYPVPAGQGSALPWGTCAKCGNKVGNTIEGMCKPCYEAFLAEQKARYG